MCFTFFKRWRQRIEDAVDPNHIHISIAYHHQERRHGTTQIDDLGLVIVVCRTYSATSVDSECLSPITPRLSNPSN